MSITATIGNILYASFGMFWSIFWALMLGFIISGAIMAFIPKKKMTRVLGGSGPKELLLATFFGAASSSCSYAAASMSKNLFQKGASIISALAFLLASTNLVLELSLVLLLMMGWQFVAAEFVGGILLVIVMAILMRLFSPLKEFEKKRGDGHAQGPMDNSNGVYSPFTLEGWEKASQEFVMEWKMIWKDIALGLLISGVIMVLVPNSFWQALFLSGSSNSDLRVVENALVGPIVSMLSFVCSVGNIPLASILYHGGISFGGAISFIYADLIIVPLILIYKKYYGWSLALWITGIFYTSMVISGIAVELLFRQFGWIPEHHSMPAMGEMQFFSLNYTFWLNIFFLIVALVMTWLAKSKGKQQGSDCCTH